jgi:hypothetical protein
LSWRGGRRPRSPGGTRAKGETGFPGDGPGVPPTGTGEGTGPAGPPGRSGRHRFHVYDTVIINERFDSDNPDANDVLAYFEALPMATRRQTFVVLLTERFRTSDNMAAFNKSVNLVVNLTNMNDFDPIFKRGLADHTAFYHVFKETLKKMGKI